MNEWMKKWMERLPLESWNRWKAQNEWMNERINERMNEWMNEWMNE